VRRQGLEPRTVALRVLVRRILDLRRWAGIGCDLGIYLPPLSVADPRWPIVRGPSAAQGKRGVPVDAASSVSGTPGRSRSPAVDGGACRLSWADGGLVVTVVRCGPVVRGPDVAPMWPSSPDLGRRLPAVHSAEIPRR